jgi:P pilus assembly chaperone PapD
MRYFQATALMAFCSFAWSGAEAATVTGTFNVQVTIAATCVLNSASNLNFGTQGVLAANVDQTSTITVTCTNTTSPPAVELQPAQDYVARVVRVTKKPVEGEEAYRLFIDELPEAPQGQRTVNLVVRHSVPLFFDAPGSSAPEAAWRVTQNAHAVSLSAANGGDRRLRLASVRIGEAAGKGISFGPGLVGYALGHSAMSWTAPGSRSVFRPGARVTISGLTEAGPFNAQAVVQSAR